MKNPFFRIAGVLIVLSLILPGCIARPTTCNDPLGCVEVGNKQPIKIAALLTLSGPDSPYGIDALRGVEIAIAAKKEVAGHPIELVKVDDLCTAEGGEQGARQIVTDPTIVGVIGATCSPGSLRAVKILGDAGMVMISPSSTAALLASPEQYQPAFFRTIYNDDAQGKIVAEFVYRVLGLRTMSTIDDKEAYSWGLTTTACEVFERLGGDCIGRYHVESGADVTPQMFWLSKLNTEALYFPVYTVDGVNIVKAHTQLGMSMALISSDGLLSRDFVTQTAEGNQGMYISGPAEVRELPSFVEEYKARYGEAPTASYHLQAYDAAMLLFDAIQDAVAANSPSSGSVIIRRQALRDALREVNNLAGLSGTLTCSQFGDCAPPNIQIFQVKKTAFTAIYP